MSDVFISFIHEENAYAEAVKAFLSQLFGKDVISFLASDKLQVYAGENWLNRIMDELKTAKVVILMLSKKSVVRPWVNFEAGAAWTNGITIIPVCYGGLSADDLPKPYSSLQAVNLEVRDHGDYLGRSVAHHLGIDEPMTYIESIIITGVGPAEYQMKCKVVEAAYAELYNKLFELSEERTKQAD